MTAVLYTLQEMGILTFIVGWYLFKITMRFVYEFFM